MNFVLFFGESCNQETRCSSRNCISSNHFFNKDAKYLKDEESARMAAVLPNPKRMRVEPASPYVQKRKDWILRNMMNLSGIAYYNYPEPEVVKDSVQTDSMFIFDIPFINRVEISGIGLSLSDARAVDKANKDSSKTDSVMNRDLRF